jgi:predicted MFS family arabinose efflux permease
VGRPALRDGVDLLGNRDFARLFAAHLIAWFGTSMAPIAIAFGVLQSTGSARDTGLVIASQTGAQVLGLLLGGVVADRVSRRRVMVCADLLAMASQATMAIAFVSGHAHVPLLMVLMMCNGVALAFHQPALMGFIPQVVALDKLQAANALLGTARSGAFALGAACAGVSVALFGSGPTIAVNAVGFATAAALVSRIAAAAPAAPRDGATILQDLSAGWSEFVSHRWLWVIVAQYALVVAAGQSVYGLIGPAVATQSMGGAPDWGFITAAYGVGALCGGFVALRIDVVRPMLFATNCVFVYAAPAALLACSSSVWPIALATFAHGVSGQIFAVLWTTTLHRKIPRHALSRVSAYDNLGSIVLAPLGIVAAGFMLEWVGARTTLLVAAAMVVVPTALALLDHDVRRLRFEG